MLITYVLIAHIALAAAVSAGFAYRYYLAFKQKAYPDKGRRSVFTGSILLVISGVLLAGVGKLPITGLCLDSLGLITGLFVLEYGLKRLGGHLSEVKERSDK